MGGLRWDQTHALPVPHLCVRMVIHAPYYQEAHTTIKHATQIAHHTYQQSATKACCVQGSPPPVGQALPHTPQSFPAYPPIQGSPACDDNTQHCPPWSRHSRATWHPPPWAPCHAMATWSGKVVATLGSEAPPWNCPQQKTCSHGGCICRGRDPLVPMPAFDAMHSPLTALGWVKDV